MVAETEEEKPEDKEIVREEVNIQYVKVVLLVLIIFTGSFLLPGFIFMIYVLYFFVPYFLENDNFFALFTEPYSLIAFLTIPIVIICIYILHLFCMSVITRIFWRYTEKKSPSKSGYIPRNIPSKTLNYYHLRSAMIKYPKNALIKGPFPWLFRWATNFIGSNKLGKGTTIEEQVCGERFMSTGENCYLGTNTSTPTHLVEGSFGNVSYFEIKLGHNVVLSAFNGVAPGCELEDDAYLLPVAATPKFSVLKGSNFYFGIPLRKIFKKRLMQYLQITKEDLDKAEALRLKNQEKQKDKRIDRFND